MSSVPAPEIEDEGLFGRIRDRVIDAGSKEPGDDLERARLLGAFALVLEGIPAPLAAQVTASLSIPTIGIGAGVECSGQVLVIYDLLGLDERFKPRFVKRYESLSSRVVEALTCYAQEVREGQFPGPEHSREA